MDLNGSKEDTQVLINNDNNDDNNNNNNGYYGSGVEAMKVVEYMLSSMSKELLTKFPDNSAFDFDYTQSSIWSPLVPHPSHPNSPMLELPKKLCYEEEEYVADVNVNDMVSSGSCVFSCFKIPKKVVMKRRRRSGFRGFEEMGSGCLTSKSLVTGSVRVKVKEGWKKVLKAASKQFKKTIKKKESSSSHMKLSTSGFSYVYYY